jgi:hypothetical protein
MMTRYFPCDKQMRRYHNKIFSGSFFVCLLAVSAFSSALEAKTTRAPIMRGSTQTMGAGLVPTCQDDVVPVPE